MDAQGSASLAARSESAPAAPADDAAPLAARLPSSRSLRSLRRQAKLQAGFEILLAPTRYGWINFLDLLRAGHTDYVINEAALDYMRGRALAGVRHPSVWRRINWHGLPIRPHWQAHLDRLDIGTSLVTPDPICIAIEGALWGSIQAHGMLREIVIVSDDAGQFAVGRHALCWVHAERLVHKLDTFTDLHRAAQKRMRALIWRLYDDLKEYRADPTARRRGELRARFDRIFRRRTGFVALGSPARAAAR